MILILLLIIFITGALSHDSITIDDIMAGRYDGALIFLSMVNWIDTEQILLLRSGTIGQIVQEQGAFRVELRGLSGILDQVVGRVFTRDCAWNLGDSKCQVDMTSYTYQATITAITDNNIVLTCENIQNASEASNLITGNLSLTSGKASGLQCTITNANFINGNVVITTILPISAGIVSGDFAVLVGGCDRSFTTCCNKFDNAINFGGFPHMPGNDFALSVASHSDSNDGGKL